MDQTATPEIKRIVSTVLHHIDVDAKKLKLIPIPNANAELESYLHDLLEEIKDKTQKRSYEFVRETTEFYGALVDYFKSNDLEKNSKSAGIASRLLDKEIDTERDYGHLGKAGVGHVKKGSFLQFIYREGENLSYLGVKIEHQEFLDETDFIKRIGLSLINKIFKACWVTYGESGVPLQVYVYDTNTKPAVYWWRDFLELKQTRDDAYNTKTAIVEVVRVLDSIRHKYPADYSILRNASVAAFKQDTDMVFDTFVTNTFAHYTPEDNELATSHLPVLIEKLKELPVKKNFDSVFKIQPKEVPFRKKSIAVSQEITLSLSEGIDNIEEKIWSEITAGGQKLVVIKSTDNKAFSSFKLKERKE